jgi:hypothetical protein
MEARGDETDIGETFKLGDENCDDEYCDDENGDGEK